MLETRLRYFDISPLISPELAVWPGDIPFQRRISSNFNHGIHYSLSSILSTVHIGAHTDAPVHYHPQGQGIEERDLNFYLGKCQVITVKKPPNTRIFPDDISKHTILAPRILFRTLSFRDPNRWNSDFNSLSFELIEQVSTHGVILVGIDTPSIDLAADKVLEAHQAVYQKNMAILEGIVLDEVPDGLYTLIALPLKIQGSDASPVRAILIPDEESREDNKGNGKDK